MYKTFGFNLKDIYKSNSEISEEMNAILQQREIEQQKLEEDKKDKDNKKDNKDKNTDKVEKPKRKKFLGIF